MKAQRQATSLMVFKTVGARRFHIIFRDTAISALIFSPFDKMITIEVLKQNETFVAV